MEGSVERVPAARWLPSFVALSVLWGSSFALIKIGVDAGVSPLWVALWRCLLGTIALLVVCAVQRVRLPRDRVTWGHAAVVAALLNAAPFALFAYGEQHVDSVLAGIINATTPLLTLVFVLMMVAEERLSGPRLAGLALGFLGVLVVLGIWNGIAGGTVVGGVACLLATTCYGAGFAYTRRFFSHRPGGVTALSTVQIACATVQLAVVTAAVQEVPTWPGWYAAVALLVLGVLGTGIAYILNLNVIRHAGPTIASTVTYVIPLWSTAFGALLLGEPISWNTFAGAVLVIAGILVTRMKPRVPATAGT
jgi:drug/metabolite transporter (DMT)-like permease